jgi:hypothetical protein
VTGALLGIRNAVARDAPREEYLMRIRNLFGVALLLAFVAACGGGGPTQAPNGATQNPAATGGGGGGATAAPGATQSGGGGGGTGQYGSVQFHVTGPVEASGTYDFLPAGSIFGGSAGAALNFTNSSDSGSILSIIVDPSGKVAVSYVSTAGQVPGASCTTSDWDMQATSARGKFDCTAEMSITGSGAAVAGGKITGEFTAHT